MSGRTGVFLINLSVSVDISNGSDRTIARAFLQRDTGSGLGYLDVNGTRMFIYCRQQEEGENTASTSTILNVSSGDQFRVQVIPHAGNDTLQTIAQACSLTISELV